MPFATIHKDRLKKPMTTMASLETRSLDACIGRRVLLEEYGCDEPFADLLPVKGVLVRRLEAMNGVRDWYVLELDKPLEHAGLTHTQLLVRPRRADARLGGREETSVFILLIHDFPALEETPIDVRKFDHIGYGIVKDLDRVEEPKRKEIKEPSVSRRRCHQCSHMYNETETCCPECGTWRFNPFSAEIAMALKVLLGGTVTLLLLWAALSVDPIYARTIGYSTLWIKGLQGIGGLAIILMVLDLVVKRIFRRKK